MRCHRRPSPRPDLCGRSRRVFRRLTALAAGLLLGYPVCQAISDTSEGPLQAARRAAEPYATQGFDLRPQPFTGVFAGTEAAEIKQQLFRGNEYWFWAASTLPEGTLRLEILDEAGESIVVEDFSREAAAGARVLPKRSGVYVIRLVPGEGSGAESGGVGWALVYGYR